jgi:hypothetical protein
VYHLRFVEIAENFLGVVARDPPRVAATVVGEAARDLDAVGRQTGDCGAAFEFAQGLDYADRQ